MGPSKRLVLSIFAIGSLSGVIFFSFFNGSTQNLTGNLLNSLDSSNSTLTKNVLQIGKSVTLVDPTSTNHIFEITDEQATIKINVVNPTTNTICAANIKDPIDPVDILEQYNPPSLYYFQQSVGTEYKVNIPTEGSNSLSTTDKLYINCIDNSIMLNTEDILINYSVGDTSTINVDDVPLCIYLNSPYEGEYFSPLYFSSNFDAYVQVLNFSTIAYNTSPGSLGSTGDLAVEILNELVDGIESNSSFTVSSEITTTNFPDWHYDLDFLSYQMAGDCLISPPYINPITYSPQPDPDPTPDPDPVNPMCKFIDSNDLNSYVPSEGFSSNYDGIERVVNYITKSYNTNYGFLDYSDSEISQRIKYLNEYTNQINSFMSTSMPLYSSSALVNRYDEVHNLYTTTFNGANIVCNKSLQTFTSLSIVEPTISMAAPAYSDSNNSVTFNTIINNITDTNIKSVAFYDTVTGDLLSAPSNPRIEYPYQVMWPLTEVENKTYSINAVLTTTADIEIVSDPITYEVTTGFSEGDSSVQINLNTFDNKTVGPLPLANRSFCESRPTTLEDRDQIPQHTLCSSINIDISHENFNPEKTIAFIGYKDTDGTSYLVSFYSFGPSKAGHIERITWDTSTCGRYDRGGNPSIRVKYENMECPLNRNYFISVISVDDKNVDIQATEEFFVDLRDL